MAVRVVIPWRRGCPHREAALSRVVLWWEEHHPEWHVKIGEYPADEGPWRKSLAIADAGPFQDDDIVIVSDADVVCESTELAVEALQRREPFHLWAMPHRTVHRLTDSATQAVVDRIWWPAQVMTQRQLQPFLSRSYVGYPGGGLVVLRGRVLNRIPMDPRFAGWGQEDHSWSLALSMLAGAPWRGHGLLWHLWHPPAPRIQPGVGSEAGVRLWHRYRSATTPEAMRGLAAEARAEMRRLG